MAFNIKATLDAVASFIAKSGYCRGGVLVGEPKAPPAQNGDFAAALFMSRVGVAELTLQTTIEIHVVTLRIYRNMVAEPKDQIETGLADVVSRLTADLLGDADLGATVRNIDAGGQYGTALGCEWGYVDVSGTIYRVADITLPLIVDDSATTAL